MTDVWAECRERWLNSRRSAATRRAYAADVAAFLAQAGGDPAQVTPAQAAAWADALKLAHSPATVCRRLASLSSFYRYAASEYGLDCGNPFAAPSLRPRVSPYGKARQLTLAELRLLIRQIPRADPAGWRDMALILGLYITCRRVSEWVALRGEDIHRDGQQYWYAVTGKGGARCRHALPLALWRLIERYLRLARRWPLAPDAYVFAGTQGRPLSARMVALRLRRYGLAAGIAEGKLHPHALRHGGARERRRRGATVDDLKSFLDHANLAVTQVYTEQMLDVPEDPLGELLAQELSADL